MGFKLLGMIFSVGKFVALTPSSINTKKETLVHKIYILFFYVSFTIAKTYSIYFNKVLEHDKAVYSIIECAVRLAIYGFNFYAMIVVNFWKREKWNQLLTNLKISNQIVVVKKKRRKMPYYLKFLLAMTSYLLLGGYACYENYQISQWGFVTTLPDTHMQSFVCSFYSFALFTIARMLLRRYKKLNIFLQEHHDYPFRTIPNKYLMGSLRKVARTIGLLRKTVDIFNDLFGWSMALMIFWTTSVILYSILSLMYHFDESLSFFIYIFIAMVWTILLLFVYNSVMEEAAEISYSVSKVQWRFSSLTHQQKDELYELTAYIRENLPQFSAAGFFSVKRSTLLSIAATTINFLIVAIQLTELIQFRMIKLALIVTFLIHLTINSLHILELVLTFDGGLLVKYGSTLVPLVYGTATVIFDLMLETRASAILKATFSEMWSLDSTGTKTAKRIKKESWILIGLVMIDTSLAITTTVLFLPIMNQDTDVYYAIHWFESKFSPSVSFVLSIFYFCTIPVLFFAMLCTTFALFYIMMYEKFQSYAVNDLLKNISRDYSSTDWKMLHDQIYQNKIYRRLRVCIKRYQVLKQMESGINKIIYTPVVVLVCLASALYISLGYKFIVLGIGEKDDYIRSCVAILAAAFNGTLFFYYGQSLINDSLDITANVWNCPWTAWNNRNRKILIFFLMKLQRPLILGNPNIFVLEYGFVIKALQFMFSTLTFFSKITSPEN